MNRTERLTWYGGMVLIGFFLISQIWIISREITGPFFDEGIYITAGLRTLDGHGYSDGYLVWFAGHLLWPALAGIGYMMDGLVGTRLVALLFVEIALIAVFLASKNLYGYMAAFWTLVLFMISGPVWSLAHLGVYDTSALAGIAVSFWAVTRLYKSDHRFWLVVSAISFTFGVMSKYPMIAMALPLAAIIVILRRERSQIDFGIFTLIFLAMIQPLVLPFREHVGAWLQWTLTNKPTFGSTRTMIMFAQIFFAGLPVLLGTVAFLAKRSKLTLILLLSGFIWPMYHIVTGNPVGDSKHVLFGFLFLYPLIGSWLAGLKGKNMIVAAATVLVFIAVGLYQYWNLERGWNDVRPGATYLVEHVKPGDQLLINNSWSYTMYLYGEGKIETPWDVFDVYRITHNENKQPLCAFDWFVNEQGPYAWPREILDEVDQCGFKMVYEFDGSMVGLASDLKYYNAQIPTTIWHRED